MLILAFLLPPARAQAPLTPEAQERVLQDAVDNEVKLIQYDQSYLLYKIHIRDSKGDQIRIVAESQDGTVARLIRKSNKPITAQDDQLERQRLQAMLDSPAAFHKHIEKDQTGKKLAVDLIRLMPAAFIFTPVPGQPQPRNVPPGKAPAYAFDFAPNPKWSPPTMTAQALTGLRGRTWVDAETHHLVRFEGDIFQGVNFGFGMLAHIYPGGKLYLEQTPVGDKRWIVNHFIDQLTLRAMMVKTIHEDVDLEAFDFSLIRPMSYQDAIHLLLDTPLPQ